MTKFIILGLLMMLISVVAKFYFEKDIVDFISGILFGAGIGCIFYVLIRPKLIK
jgi:hypothetical protein